MVARLDGQSVTAVEGRDVPQSLVLGVARQTASEALSHSEAFTADLVFIKDILGILGFVWSWHMVVAHGGGGRSPGRSQGSWQHIRFPSLGLTHWPGIFRPGK